MAGVRTRVSLSSRIPQLAPRAERVLRRKLADLAAEMQGQAQRDVPIDTGELHDSISARSREVGPPGIDFEATAEHASHVEYGTTRMAAQPYFTPALELVPEGVKRAVSEAFAEVLAGAEYGGSG